MFYEKLGEFNNTTETERVKKWRLVLGEVFFLLTNGTFNDRNCTIIVVLLQIMVDHANSVLRINHSLDNCCLPHSGSKTPTVYQPYTFPLRAC